MISELKPHEVEYPHNDNFLIFSPYIGQRVVNIHAQYTGRHNAEALPLRQGVLVHIQSGCNGLLMVKWDGYETVNYCAEQDCALQSTYPQKRWPHEGT